MSIFPVWIFPGRLYFPLFDKLTWWIIFLLTVSNFNLGLAIKIISLIHITLLKFNRKWQITDESTGQRCWISFLETNHQLDSTRGTGSSQFWKITVQISIRNYVHKCNWYSARNRSLDINQLVFSTVPVTIWI